MSENTRMASRTPLEWENEASKEWENEASKGYGLVPPQLPALNQQVGNPSRDPDLHQISPILKGLIISGLAEL